MTLEQLEVLITANTQQLQSEINKAQKNVQQIAQTATKSSKGIATAVMVGTIATKALSMAISAITSNLDDAITRLDSLNNFPRVMSNLGVSSEDANASMKRLNEALVGLPTTLDQATQSVQRFTSANGNVKASTEMFLALNNAILAGGASTDIQKSALEQLSQSYAKGKPDMMEWRTAMTAMPAQLKQVAIAMGYASADQLGESLRNGSVSMNDFMKKIIELNKTGANGFQSFEEQARNSTGGVSTSITNVKTAITRGLAEIMNAIGQSNIAGFFQGVAKAINSVIPYITGFVKACVWAVGMVSSLFGKSIGKSVESANNSINGLNSGISGTAGNIDKATGSAKKLKNELKSLAGFDEMNVLSVPNNSDAGGSGGGASSIAGGLGDLDLSGFDSGIGEVSSKAEEVAEKIKTAFIGVGEVLRNIWNSEPVQAFAGVVTTYAQFVFDYWSMIGTNLYKNITNTWGNIQGNVSIILGNMNKLWTTFWKDIDAGIKTWGQPIIDGVKGVFNSIWQDAFDPYIQLITKTWADFSQILVDLWDKHGKSLIDNIGEFAVKTIALFQKIWDKVIEPIVTPFLETLSWLWDNHLKGLIKNVGDLVMSVVNGALEIYNKFIQPIVMWLLDKLSPAWAYLSNLVIGIMGTILGVISDVISGIVKVFRGIIDFIVGVFTGNWSKAWDGISSIFTGIWDTLEGIVKGVINAIIDAINSFIAGINKVKFQAPDWVPGIGGKSWGVNIPKIPKLAKGGIVDKPTIAEIGERRKRSNNTIRKQYFRDRKNS